jgi:aromatic-L-amino-acid decarboxylase
MAPSPFSTVCLRWRPARDASRRDEPAVAERLDALNERLLARLNETGEVFLSHTRLDGRFTLRVAINGIRTEPRHVERVWELIRTIGRELDTGS